VFLKLVVVEVVCWLQAASLPFATLKSVKTVLGFLELQT
jgi:hypothetical protein